MLDNTPDILNIKDLMSTLHIGKNTALNLIRDKKIKAHKTSYGWRIFKEDVIEYLEHI